MSTIHGMTPGTTKSRRRPSSSPIQTEPGWLSVLASGVARLSVFVLMAATVPLYVADHRLGAHEPSWLANAINVDHEVSFRLLSLCMTFAVLWLSQQLVFVVRVVATYIQEADQPMLNSLTDLRWTERKMIPQIRNPHTCRNVTSSWAALRAVAVAAAGPASGAGRWRRNQSPSSPATPTNSRRYASICLRDE